MAPDVDGKSVGEHLHELRGRLIHGALAWLLCTAAAFHYRETLMAAFAEPVGPLVFLDPSGAFLAYLKLAALVGLMAVLPYLVFEAGRFLAPAMEAGSARILAFSLAASLALFYAGSALGWWLTKRAAAFLLGFAGPAMRPLVTAEHYFGFAALLVLGTGLVFQMPVLVAALARLGLLSSEQLSGQWRFAMLGSVLAAALLTPSPDAFTQLLLAVPLMALYGVSVWVAGWVERVERAREAREKKLISEPDLSL